MNNERLDAVARQVGQSSSRRWMARVVLGAALGSVVPWLASPAPEAGARRHACQVRCGGDQRLCKNDCRNAPIVKQCKRTCRVLRDQCFGRCEFKPLRRRLVRAW